MSSDIPDLSRLKVGTATQAPKNIPIDPPGPVPEMGPIMPEDLLAGTEDSIPLAPAKSPEMIQKEEEARVIISLYKCKFPEELAVLGAELDPMSLSQMDLAQLEVMRERCDKLLGAGSGCEVKRKVFNTLLYVIEKAGCMSGVQCEGLTATLLNDKDYQRDITRLALKYLSANECRPELTVPLKVLTTCVQLHANAEIKQKQQIIQEQLSKADAAKKIQDIDKKYDNIG